MQAFDGALHQDQTGMDIQRIVGAAVDPTCQAGKPAGARVVDGQVRGDAECRQVIRSQGGSGRPLPVEGI